MPIPKEININVSLNSVVIRQFEARLIDLAMALLVITISLRLCNPCLECRLGTHIICGPFWEQKWVHGSHAPRHRSDSLDSPARQWRYSSHIEILYFRQVEVKTIAHSILSAKRLRRRSEGRTLDSIVVRMCNLFQPQHTCFTTYALVVVEKVPPSSIWYLCIQWPIFVFYYFKEYFDPSIFLYFW